MKAASTPVAPRIERLDAAGIARYILQLAKGS